MNKAERLESLIPEHTRRVSGDGRWVEYTENDDEISLTVDDLVAFAQAHGVPLEDVYVGASMPLPETISRTNPELDAPNPEVVIGWPLAMENTVEKVPVTEDHVVNFDETGWVIMHPLSCRPNLFECKYNKLITTLAMTFATTDAMGNYKIRDEDGTLSLEKIE